MVKVSIIGSGNVAQHLALAFEKAPGTELLQVFSRHGDSVFFIDQKRVVSDFGALEQADLYIIAVTDAAIAGVSYDLPFENRLVAHTSGSVPMAALDSKNRKAVFYPLQTFSKDKEIDFIGIPLCLETEQAADFEMLRKVAAAISDKTFAIDSQQRRAIHVSAVFVNNFVNHLYAIGNDICDEHNIPFEILKPLIVETAQKVMTLSPLQAQTGPAKRNDRQTIETHLSMLQNQQQQDIYKLLTQSIKSHEQRL